MFSSQLNSKLETGNPKLLGMTRGVGANRESGQPQARVVQLADTAVSKTVSSPFESEREYQSKVSSFEFEVLGFLKPKLLGWVYNELETRNWKPETRNPKLETFERGGTQTGKAVRLKI